MTCFRRLILCCIAAGLGVGVLTTTPSAANEVRLAQAQEGSRLPQWTPEPVRPMTAQEVSDCNLGQKTCMRGCDDEYERRPKEGLAYKTCVSRCQSDGTRCRRGIR